VNEPAERILRRLDRAYPFKLFTTLPAARSVSQLAANGHRAGPIKLAASRSVSAEQTLAATEIGDATHIVMEHIDFDRPATESSLREQMTQMVERRFLTEATAASVDLGGVAWFMTSELGKLMQTHAAKVRRELALSFARPDVETPALDPLDRTMVRGRIDVLIPLADRCVLIDYKTDRLAPDAIGAQVEHHRAQISLYSNAIESVLHSPVEGYLAFLTARQWRPVNPHKAMDE
jgi:ATP-dependent helicase/nuclease subunit A